MAQNPRKDPLRIRRSSKKEFSRVATLLKSLMETNTERINKLEARVDALEAKKARGRPKKPKE